ncbi:hypothetical protein C8R46DRAFT_1042168 [Mycena filopes]|nr:hypothetical protein C8R46DRAFT_1042168 [Mycena filopes]
MAREKKSVKSVPRGRKSDFTGEKAEWLDSFKATVTGAGLQGVGAEYTDITNRFILRYGYDLPFKQNTAEDPTLNPPVISEDVTPEETTRRKAIRAKLRTKLSCWYRMRYRNKKVHGGSINKILSTMQEMAGAPRPRCKTAVTVYSKLHYDTRLKPGFDAVWAEAKKTLPEKMRVSMSQDYVRAQWEGETEEFKKSIEEQAASMHAEAMEQWKAGRNAEMSSAEEYHEALENLDEVAIPFADALAERTGLHIVILAVGPVGSQEGQVRLRTIFSDTAEGNTAKTWSEFDHRGFTAMEQSITRYGNTFFTKTDCDRRAWPPLVAPDPATVPNLLQLAPLVVPIAPPAAPAVVVTPANPAVVVTPANPAVVVTPANPAVLVTPANAATVTPAADGIDRTDWDPNFVAVYAYLSSKKWGPTWDKLLAALIRFEWSHYFEDDDGKITAITHRPAEIGQWMKRHRLLTDDFPIDEKEGPFGTRLIAWWAELGPKNRWDEYIAGTNKEAPEQDGQEYHDRSHLWKQATQPGRNGVQVVILALAWWGQDIWNRGAGDGLGGGDKALEAEAEWQMLMQDIVWVLTMHPLTRPREDTEDEGDAKEGKEEEVAVKGKGKRGKGKGKAEEKKKSKAEEKKSKAEEKKKTAAPTAPKKRKTVDGDGETTARKRAKKSASTSATSMTSTAERPRPKPAFKKKVVPDATGDVVMTDGAPDTAKPDAAPAPNGNAPPPAVNAAAAAAPVDGANEIPAPDTAKEAPALEAAKEAPAPDTAKETPAPDTTKDTAPAIPANAATAAPDDAAKELPAHTVKETPAPDTAKEAPAITAPAIPANAAPNTANIAAAMDVDTEDPFAKATGDPFAEEDDTLAGLTEEERREMEDDPEADMEPPSDSEESDTGGA